MWSALLVTATLAQAAAVAQAPAQNSGQAPATATATPPSNNWLVIVAAPVYQPDGAVAAETVNLPAAGAGLVHMFARRSLCDPAVAGAAEPASAGFGWRVASQIVSTWSVSVIEARSALADSKPGSVSGVTSCPSARSAATTSSHAHAPSQNPGTKMMGAPVIPAPYGVVEVSPATRASVR